MDFFGVLSISSSLNYKILSDVLVKNELIYIVPCLFFNVYILGLDEIEPYNYAKSDFPEWEGTIYLRLTCAKLLL